MLPMAVASLLSPGSAGFASLRLVGGGSRCDGRVEIFQHGTWGRVLDDEWDVQEASVVCRQLRCGEAGTAYNPPKPERGMGPVGLRGVRCAGHETNLAHCNTSLPESALAAGVAEDVGVICWGERHCMGPPGDRVGGQMVPDSNWALYPLQGASRSGWLTGPGAVLGEWSSTTRAPGGLCVTMAGTCLMPPSFATSWAVEGRWRRLALLGLGKAPGRSGWMA